MRHSRTHCARTCMCIQKTGLHCAHVHTHTQDWGAHMKDWDSLCSQMHANTEDCDTLCMHLHEYTEGWDVMCTHARTYRRLDTRVILPQDFLVPSYHRHFPSAQIHTTLSVPAFWNFSCSDF